MASIGSSFPYMVETKSENSALVLHRPGSCFNAFRVRKSPAFAVFSYSISGFPLRFGGKQTRRSKQYVKAKSENEGEDSLEAALAEKSKQVLAMQKELLHQIAERKKLVSSIKGNIANPEEVNSLSDLDFLIPNNRDVDGSNSNVAVSSYDESTVEEINAGKEEFGNGVPSKKTSVNVYSPKLLKSNKKEAAVGYVYSPEQLKNNKVEAATVTLDASQQLKNTTSEVQVIAPSAVKKDSSVNGEVTEPGVPLGKISSNGDSSKQLKNTDSKAVAQSTELPSFVKLASETSSVKDEQQVDSKGSSSQDVKAEGTDSTVEEAKPPPLAGANVMNVMLVAAECAPFSKTGGLGDVAGSLPKALARRGHRVMVVVPRYGNYAEPKDTGVRKRYKVDGQDLEVCYYHAYIDGVDFVFIDNNLFHHRENNIYGGNRQDILKRMILFCKAAVEVPWYVPCGGVCYGDGNLVFIANDWHTALLPVYLKAYYRDNGLMKYTRSVLVIHNIAHQGRGPVEDFRYADLPEHYLDYFKLYDPVGGEHFNIFAAGLKAADRVVTVSHGYSWELKTLEGGWGLHNIINENDWKLRGIVNGIDTIEWSPQHDVHLTTDGYTNYSLETLNTGKPQCKAALQKELGLPVREDVPLIGFIGRLDDQKGVDLIAEAIPWMMGQDVQLVMLGTGRPDLEEMLRQFENQYRDKIRGWVGFSVKTAHRITAGADVLLMPSRFEPCGLNQLYAMNYGTIPVVHAVGGLRDTVKQFDPYNESGLGWTFDSAETSKLIHALGNCLLTYRQYKKSWEGLQRRGMTQDLSWDNAAQKYEEVLVAAKYQW